MSHWSRALALHQSMINFAYLVVLQKVKRINPSSMDGLLDALETRHGLLQQAKGTRLAL
jgi:hypothetical protein